MVMHRIYSHAERVLIWLGELSSDSDLAMESFPDLVEYLRTRTHNGDHFNGSQDLDNDWPEQHWGFRADSIQVVALRHLLLRSWFCRMWTLQEAALAPSTSIVLCGNRQFEFSDLQEFYSHGPRDAGGLWLMARTMMEGSGPDVRQNPAWLYMSITRQLESLSVERAQESLAAYIFSTSRGVACTEPSDRIWYIARFIPATLLERLSRVRGNETSQLYTELAMHEINRGFGEAFLAAAGLSQRRQVNGNGQLKLSSWVPDWTWAGVYHSFSRMNLTYRIKHDKILYQAAGRSEVRMQASEHSNRYVLHAKCKRLGAVSSTLDPFIAPPEFDNLEGGERTTARIVGMDMLTDYLLKSLQLANSCELGHHGDNWETSCLRTLTANFLTQDHPDFAERNCPQPTDEEINREFEEAIFVFKYTQLSFRMRELNRRDRTTWTQEDFVNSQAFIDFKARFSELANQQLAPTQKMEQLGAMCQNRRFLVTDDLYMGLAPDPAETGDRLCLVSGCCTPYVIRPLPDGRYNLIGECYLHGVMRGELLDEPVEVSFDTDIVLV